jgi:hypothetical protein
MSGEQSAASKALPPHAQLRQMGAASWISAAVYAALNSASPITWRLGRGRVRSAPRQGKLPSDPGSAYAVGRQHRGSRSRLA